MCIELYINKILVFSQCDEINNVSPYRNLTYDNLTSSNSTYSGSLVENKNFTPPMNYTYFPNYTQVHSTHDFLNYTNFTNITNTPDSYLLNGTYNTSHSLNNMTVIKNGRVPSTTPVPNITVNETLPIASDAPADFDERPYETTAEVVLKIIIPLVILAIIWISIIICRNKKKTKVQCVKMIENPYFGADVETPKEDKILNKTEIEHKDPDVKPNIEHKDPDIKNQPKNHEESSTEPRL